MRKRWTRIVSLVGMLALMTAYASAQGMPPISLRGNERTLTPEERERQKQIDDDYKAASKKVPDQKANDAWAAIRPAPSTPSPKKPTVAGPKKKQQ